VRGVSAIEQIYQRTRRMLRSSQLVNKEAMMLTTILVVLGILWLLGFSLNIGGGLIHTLLVGALAIFIVNQLTGRRIA
jgi:hypothetical protein